MMHWVLLFGAVVPLAIETARPAGRLVSADAPAVRRTVAPIGVTGFRPLVPVRLGASLGALTLAGTLGPSAAIAAVLLAVAARWRMRVARSAKLERQRRRELVEVAELIMLGLRNGHPVPLLCRSVPARLHGEVASALADVGRRHRQGSSFAEALDRAFAPIGPDAVALARLLASSEIDGASVSGALAEYVDGLRAETHVRVETAARQLPVRMLGPLIVCVLPAFLALTVAPVVLERVSALLA